MCDKEYQGYTYNSGLYCSRQCSGKARSEGKHRMTKSTQYLPNGIKHGDRFYRIWSDMKTRCTNENYKNYVSYGGRGIEICREWNEFINFYNDMYSSYVACKFRKPTIDRIDVNGNYTLENCRWATIEEQQKNRRNNRYFKFMGRNKLLGEWAKELDINYSTLSMRYYKYGWSIEKTLTQPVRSIF